MKDFKISLGHTSWRYDTVVHYILAAEVAAELAEIQEKEELEKQIMAAKEEQSPRTPSPENVSCWITNPPGCSVHCVSRGNFIGW